MKILVLDNETPWVRALFLAMPQSVRVDFLGVYNIRERRFRPGVSLLGMFRQRRISTARTDQYVWVPTRLRRTTRVLLRLYRRLAYGPERYDWVVVTNPFAAYLLGAFKGSRLIYQAYDPFEYYPHWGGPSRIRPLEQKLLDRCDVVVAVSRQLQSDFVNRTDRPVIYLPNAANSAWLQGPSVQRPADLPSGQLVVGCIGQINQSYDWDLIKRLAELRRECTFVFVGPLIEADGPGRVEIETVFALPNVCWLGSRPHERLPDYMRHFDVCFSPLRVSGHNQRRSPLRLFDYLTTERPVLSTSIAEALEHVPHIITAQNVDEANQYLRNVLEGNFTVAKAARHQYMLGQTWDARAAELLRHIENDDCHQRKISRT